jgi:hypothetical protein
VSIIFYSGVLQALTAGRDAIPLLAIGIPAGVVCLVLAATILWVRSEIGADRMDVSRLAKGAAIAKVCRMAMLWLAPVGIVARIAAV